MEVFLLRSQSSTSEHTRYTKTKEYVIKQCKTLVARTDIFSTKPDIKIYRMIGHYCARNKRNLKKQN